MLPAEAVAVVANAIETDVTINGVTRTTVATVKKPAIETDHAANQLRTLMAKADADKTWANFKAHFLEAEAALAVKANRGRTSASRGYHAGQQANHVAAAKSETYTKAEVDAMLATFAAATDEHLQQLVGEPAGTKEQDAAVPAAGGFDALAKLLSEQTKALTELTKEVKTLATKSSGRTDRRACKHFGRHHPRVPEKDCYWSPKNKDKSPEEGGPPAGAKPPASQGKKE